MTKVLNFDKIPIVEYTEAYRSGHNGTDSKSVVPHGTVGSNPTASATKALAPASAFLTNKFNGGKTMTLETQNLNKTQSARIDYIDLFRSVGIIFMVMGHIGFGDVFYYFIHAFHMPMFFWISGYLFKHRTKEEMSFGAFVLKKVKTLLVPYIVFGAAHCLFDACVKLVTNETVEIESMLNLLWFNTHKLPICGALWFLTSLFFADIIFFLIDRYIQNKPLKAVVIAAIAVAGCLLKSVFSVTLPFALGTSFVGVGLYYIGHLFRKYGEKKIIHTAMNLSWLPTILLGIATVVLIFVNQEINMRKEIYGIIPLFWINAVLCVIEGMNLSKLIYKFIQGNIIGKWLTEIGKNSIVYVCLNQVVILVCDKLIKMVDMPLIVSQTLILAVSLAVLWVTSLIFMKTKLKVLVGRK